MKLITLASCLLFFFLSGCSGTIGTEPSAPDLASLSTAVKSQTLRAWRGYERYAWGHDVLHPLSKGYHDWYEEPLALSLIDAYSTLKVMELDTAAARIERYVSDTLDLNRDIFVKTFEVDIRMLGGLLAMYELSGDEQILARAREFGDRILPAWNTPHGLPSYYVNLKTGATKGDTINTAEAGTAIFEMGILSYYTGDPKYYAAAKKASRRVFSMRSPLGLVGQQIDVQQGVYIDSVAHVGACIDSYYEYLYKTWRLLGDPELKEMWDVHLPAIQQYVASPSDTSLWYGNVNRFTGEKTSGRITLWDAYFPGLLAYAGELDAARKSQRSWDGLWNVHGLEPMVWDFNTGEIEDPRYYLNPEIIESAYYLHHFTGEPEWLAMIFGYWESYLEYCKNDVAFHHVTDVRTMEPGDEMSTFLFAESLKYFFLAFTPENDCQLDQVVFSTEAHPFWLKNFDHALAKERLGY